MSERDLAEMLLRDHLLAAGALTAIQLKQLPDEVLSRVNEAVLSGMGLIELRTQIAPRLAELVLVPADGTEPLWLTRMVQRGEG